MNTVVYRHTFKRKRVDAIEASDIKAKLLWVRTSLVVRIDATDRTEIMLGSIGVELIQPELVSAADDMQTIQGHRGDDGPSTPAHGAIAAPWLNHAIWKRQLQDDLTTMATGPVLGQDVHPINIFDHHAPR